MTTPIRDVDFSQVALPTTFAGMVERTIAFLSGDGEVPYYARSGPDEETLPMVPQLIELNRRGFLTTCSQPGSATARTRQRSFVEGYADAETIRNIWVKGNAAGLLINVCDLKKPYVPRGEYGFPVTYQDGWPCTYVGRFPVRFPWSPYTGVPLEHDEEDNLKVREGFDLTVPEPWRSELLWVIAMDAVWERPAHTEDGILTTLLRCLDKSQS